MNTGVHSDTLAVIVTDDRQEFRNLKYETGNSNNAYITGRVRCRDKWRAGLV
jgi:hypothetical protein